MLRSHLRRNPERQSLEALADVLGRLRELPLDHVSSLLSSWWSWLSSTAPTGPTSSAATPGPVSLRDDLPQPRSYFAARLVEGRVCEEPPPRNPDQDVGPPMWVMRASVMGYRSLNAWPERRRNAAVSAQAAAANTAAAATNRIPGESSSGPR
jgi:hypothetical protein